MLLRYAIANTPKYFLSILLIKLWKLAGVLVRLNGIMRYL
jgi:hypothetical protein